jgi:hypothetical protein
MSRVLRFWPLVSMIVMALAVGFSAPAKADPPPPPAPGAIAGIVSHADAPVGDAVVVLKRVDRLGRTQVVARTRSNEAGRYDFARVRPGRYVVEAAKRGVGRGAARAAVVSGETTRAPIVLR